MPIEGAMHGMMSLITELGGVTVRIARALGRGVAVAYSPMIPLNYVPHKSTVKEMAGGDPRTRSFWLGPRKQFTTSTERKTTVGGPPAFSTRAGQTQSRGGQHTAIGSGRPGRKARKSIRGPSAQRKAYPLFADTSGHKVGTRGPCDPGYVYRIVNGRHMCVPRKSRPSSKRRQGR